MSTNNQTVLNRALEDIQKSSGSIIVMGVLMFLLGILAMASPLAAGVSLALAVGMMLVIGGIGQLVFAFKAGKGMWAFGFECSQREVWKYRASHHCRFHAGTDFVY